MNSQSESYRTDEQLQAILHETAIWTIHGRPGFALGHAPSLHAALDKAARLALSGATMAAITRLPGDNVVIFPPQYERLRKILAGLELCPIKGSEWSEAAN